MAGLSITRKPGQRIIIGDDIVVTITRIERREDSSDQVTVAIEAPRDIQIDREEVRVRKGSDRNV